MARPPVAGAHQTSTSCKCTPSRLEPPGERSAWWPGLRLRSFLAVPCDVAATSDPGSPRAVEYPRALLEYPSETVVVSNSDRKCFCRAGPFDSDVEFRTESMMQKRVGIAS